MREIRLLNREYSMSGNLLFALTAICLGMKVQGVERKWKWRSNGCLKLNLQMIRNGKWSWINGIRVRLLLRLQRSTLVTFLETKLTKENLDNCRHMHFKDWMSIDNCTHHPRAQIWVLWRADEYDYQFLDMGPQFIHLKVLTKATFLEFHLTVMYASNVVAERPICWEHLVILRVANALLVCGGFNNVLRPHEREGASCSFISMVFCWIAFRNVG